MPITGVKIECHTISRKDNHSLEIHASPSSESVYLSYGKRDRDIFQVRKTDLLEALILMGVINGKSAT